MTFTKNLEDIIFHTHENIIANELIIISGYVGPNPILKLSTLPLKTTVIYGMYAKDSIAPPLHNALLNIDLRFPNIQILYSNIPVHSKCYIWLNNGQVVYALIGSANFSKNGLSIPFKETLSEATFDSFQFLRYYLDQVMQNIIPCNIGIPRINITNNQATQRTPQSLIGLPYTSQNIGCNMTLLDPLTNEVPLKSGLNWQNANANVSIDDAYIPIRTYYIRTFPLLFSPKQGIAANIGNGRTQRQNDSVEFLWDDGTIMEGLLEGNQIIDGIMYPKNLCSSITKSELGIYIKTRLGLSSGATVKKADLDRYGRTDIAIYLLQEGVYYLDFSV